MADTKTAIDDATWKRWISSKRTPAVGFGLYGKVFEISRSEGHETEDVSDGALLIVQY